jgi:hypothetical protein
LNIISLEILFIVKTIKIESVDAQNHSNYSKVKQWLNEKRYPTSTPIEDTESETSSSSYTFCIPFHSCASQFNRTILIIFTAILILTCCCYYHCAEYCHVKHELDKENLYRYRYVDVYVHNKDFAT